MPLRCNILVLSDASSRGERADLSGPAVRGVLEARGWKVGAVEILPDDVELIRRRLEALTDAEDCDAVFTAGGTGVGPRDVTPEATCAVVEKEIPGLAELMRAEGVKKTRRAALCGVWWACSRANSLLTSPAARMAPANRLKSFWTCYPM